MLTILKISSLKAVIWSLMINTEFNPKHNTKSVVRIIFEGEAGPQLENIL